jgi:hypothetical protein
MSAPMDFRMEGVQQQADYIEQVRQNILNAIRIGMREGIASLDSDIVAKLDSVTTPGTGKKEDGRLDVAIAEGQKVFEKKDAYIGGEVKATPTGSKIRNLPLWLELGTKPPTKGKGLSKYPKQFLAGSNPESRAVHGHGAFRIEPHPFFNSTFQADYPTILDTINQRIAEACDAGV